MRQHNMPKTWAVGSPGFVSDVGRHYPSGGGSEIESTAPVDSAATAPRC